MKAVLISIRPKWCELIASGKKTIEVRKSRPTIETPFKCYIYCTKGEPLIYCRPSQQIGNGKVIGEFVCDSICEIINVGNAYKVGKTASETNRVARASCLDFGDMHDYLGHKGGYGWHISALKIYDEPKKLSEFKQCHKCEYYNGCKEHEYGCDGTHNVTSPPQSYMYVEEMT